MHWARAFEIKRETPSNPLWTVYRDRCDPAPLHGYPNQRGERGHETINIRGAFLFITKLPRISSGERHGSGSCVICNYVYPPFHPPSVSPYPPKFATLGRVAWASQIASNAVHVAPLALRPWQSVHTCARESHPSCMEAAIVRAAGETKRHAASA